MKKYIVRIVISVLALLHANATYTEIPNLQGHSFFYARSQSVNAAREIVGWLPHIHRYDMMDENYSSFVATGAYNQSLHGNRIADAIFGTDQLFISGSTTVGRGADNILADYFGLSPDFESTVKVEPTIQSAILSFYGFFGFNKWWRGLYLQFQVPLAWTKWNLGLRENVFEDGSNVPFPPNYMDASAVEPGAQSFVQALKGCTTFGQMQEPLEFGKVCGPRVKRSVSDVQLALGWDFLLSECGFAGLNIRCAAPAGNRSKSVFLFEPIVGNCHHWELGGGFAGRGLMWEKDGNQEVSFFGELNMTYLFSSKQRRSFDLGQEICRTFLTPSCSPCNDQEVSRMVPRVDLFGSRYMLVKEFDEDGNYTGNLAPLINKTTLDCHVRVNLQVEIVFMFDYVHNNFVLDAGYNGWIRSREIISLDDCFPENRFAIDTLGLKGIQNVTYDNGALSNATQSHATLFGNYLSEQAIVADPNPPVFIKPYDINLDSAASPLAITHKFFIYCGWSDECLCWCITPFAGFGGEIEFEGINTRDYVGPNKNTMSQWGVWAKAGFDY